MKKLLAVTLSVALSVCMCFGVSACGQNKEGGQGGEQGGQGTAHEHTYSDGWSDDETYHWHTATCEHSDVIAGKASHVWSETYERTDDGHSRTCTVCGRDEGKSSHSFGGDYIISDKGHYLTCTVCGYPESREAHAYVGGKCKTCGYELKETGELTYTAVEGGYAVSGLESGATDQYIVIPATHDGTDVVAIADNAFKSNKNITYVKIPDSVITVGDNAFNGCEKLAEVSLGNGVREIGKYAFASTVITEIALPDSLTSIGECAFYYTDLLSITVPEKATALGINVFYYCRQLKTATIKADIAEIPQGMFSYCGKLETVNLHENTVSAGSRAFKDATVLDLDTSRFTTIKSFAFQNSGIINAVIRAALVDTEAFSGCKKLTGLTLGDEVIELKSKTFAECTALKTIQIGKGLQKIGSGANGDGTHLGSFDGCTARETLTVSAENANFRSENNAILKKSTAKVSLVLANAQGDFPAGVTRIEDSAFYGNDKLINLAIPDTVTYVGECAFGGHPNLKTARMSSSLSTMNMYQFHNCEKLETVTVPAGTKKLAINMFYNCPALKAVVFEQTTGWEAVPNGSGARVALDVSNSAENVKYFTATYKAYRWENN